MHFNFNFRRVRRRPACLSIFTFHLSPFTSSVSTPSQLRINSDILTFTQKKLTLAPAAAPLS